MLPGVLGAVVAVLVLALSASAASAASAEAGDGAGGLLLRVDGDVVVGPTQSLGAVVVIQGDATVEGVVDAVVVVSGTAVLRGATVGTLVVVDGIAELSEGSVVSGDAVLPNSSMKNDGSGVIEGTVTTDVAAFRRALDVLSVVNVVVAIGGVLLTLVAALVFAGIAPGTTRAATSAISGDPGHVALSGLLFWIALPVVAIALLLTVIGAPTAFAIWVVVLPLVGGAGYLVTGIWIGQLLVDRHRERHHPYVPALLGTAILLGAGLIPILGAVVSLVAVLVGGSALALLAWRSVRSSQSPLVAVGGPPGGPGGALPPPGA